MSFTSELKSKLYYGYVMALLGFMIMFIIYVLKANCSSLFIIPITKDLGITRTAYTFHFSILAMAMMVSSFFMGRLITKYKIKYVMSACLALLTVTYVLFSQVTALWQIYIIAALQGLGYGGATTLPCNIMINNWFGAKVKGTMQSIASLGSGLGALLWINLFQYITSNYGWREANLAIAAMFAVIMLPMIFFLSVDKPAEKGYTHRPGDPAAGESSVSFANQGINFKHIWAMKRFWLQIIGQILTITCAAAITSQAVPYFNDLGMKPAAAAALYSGALGTLVFGKLILGFIADKITIPRASLVAPLVFMGTFISLSLMGDMPIMSKVFVFTYMIGGSIATIIPPILTAKNFGDKDYGSIMGVITMGGNIGQIIGPLLAAFIFDTTGSYRSAWTIFAGITLIVALCFFFSGKLSKEKAKELGYE